MVLDDDNPWDKILESTTKNPCDGILASTMFALRAMVHTTTQYTPAQLVFERDSILNTRHEANWYLKVKENQQKNRNRKEHTYK